MAKSDDQMAALVKRRFKIWREVVTGGDFVRGSVVVLRRPCTRPPCRVCASGKRHPATYFSMKGRSHSCNTAYKPAVAHANPRGDTPRLHVPRPAWPPEFASVLADGSKSHVVPGKETEL